MRIFKTRDFRTFSRSQPISDEALRDAVRRANRGLVDADLGSGLIKQRVARPGQGRSAGFRTLIAFRSENRAVFLTGFAKNERENIGPEELTYLRREATKILSWSDKQFNALLVSGAWTEIEFDE